jgi:hypothetical protein
MIPAKMAGTGASTHNRVSAPAMTMTGGTSDANEMSDAVAGDGQGIVGWEQHAT